MLKVLPVLNDGLCMQRCPEMVIACYMIAIILARKGQLTDRVLNGLMEAVASSLCDETLDPGLMCLSFLAPRKSARNVPSAVIAQLVSVKGLEVRLRSLKSTCGADELALILIENFTANSQDNGFCQRLDVIERLIWSGILSREQQTVAVTLFLRMISDENQSSVFKPAGQAALTLLQRLNDSEDFTLILSKAIEREDLDANMIESKLQRTIGLLTSQTLDNIDQDIESAMPVQGPTSLSRALERVKDCSATESTFLSASRPSELFTSLLETFDLCIQSNDGRQAFTKLPVWASSRDQPNSLLVSFCVRVFSFPHPMRLRLAALHLLESYASRFSQFRTQQVLPYFLLQLGSTTSQIRKAATAGILEIARASASASEAMRNTQSLRADSLYTDSTDELKFVPLPAANVEKILRKVILPSLEECALDRDRIAAVLQNAMKTSSRDDSTDSDKSTSGLKRHLRQTLARLLFQTILSTPLFSVKVGLLEFTRDIEKVAGIWKQNELMPVLQRWSLLTIEEAEQTALAELLKTESISTIACNIVSSTENDAVNTLLALCSNSSTHRPDMVNAVAGRIDQIWHRVRAVKQITASENLLAAVFSQPIEQSDRSQAARLVFDSLKLSTSVLEKLLEVVLSSTSSMDNDRPVTKKRRRMEDQTAAMAPNSPAVPPQVREITFVLELIDSSSSEERPQLLSGLFRVSSAIHQLKWHDQSEMSYLLSLSLGNMLTIVRHSLSQAERLDLSTVRTDVIIDCMRSSSSSQVQNTALLLIASLARVAPERILDSIMAVFAFMGDKVVGRDDERSNFVVDHTVDTIIPPLVEALKAKNQDIVAQTSDLVSSFVVAYEHIPSHRRLTLFKRLVSSLGEKQFLWVILTRLSQRYGTNSNLSSFEVSLVNLFDADVQLKTLSRQIAIVRNSFAEQANQEATATHGADASSLQDLLSISSLLQNLQKILANSNIRDRAATSDEFANDPNSNQALWVDMVHELVSLTKTAGLPRDIASVADTMLSTVLKILPVVQFLDIAEDFIKTGTVPVRQKTLQLVEARISKRCPRSPALQSRALSFLQPLLAVIQTSEDDISKHVAVACLDTICRVFGRKNPAAILQAAETISDDSCLQADNKGVATPILLCLTSLVDQTKAAIVPLVPQVTSKTFRLLEQSLRLGEEDAQLHDASFALISALISHTPFIISEEYLEQIMALAALSAIVELPPQSHEVRQQTLHLVSAHIELPRLLGPMRRKWPMIVEKNISAVLQAVAVLSDSVKASPKPLIVKHSRDVIVLLLQMLDLRRSQSTTETKNSFNEKDVSIVESHVSNVTIEVIYRLNDSIFRPLFIHMIDWATACSDVPMQPLAKSSQLRQTALFNFHTRFFHKLKSIVTPYASFLVPPIVTLLEGIAQRTTSLTCTKPVSRLKKRPQRIYSDSLSIEQQNERLHYLSALRALRAALMHDQDSHFSNPALFDRISSSLVSQLPLVAYDSIFASIVSTHVIPTTVALAVTVIDNPDHLRSLNSLISQLRRRYLDSPETISLLVKKATLDLQLALAGCPFSDDKTNVNADANADWRYNLTARYHHGGRDQRLSHDVDANEEDRIEATIAEQQEAKSALAEEWCSSILGVGEGMVYVNEMLEDGNGKVDSVSDGQGNKQSKEVVSSSDIRMAARKLAERIKEVVGEDEIS